MKAAQQLTRSFSPLLRGSGLSPSKVVPSMQLQPQRHNSSAAAAASPWATYEMGPPDPIIGLNEAYQKDDYPGKVIVGVGAYRDDHGKPHVLPCVRAAEQKLMDQKLDMEYSGIVSVCGEPIRNNRSRIPATMMRDELNLCRKGLAWKIACPTAKVQPRVLFAQPAHKTADILTLFL